MAETDQKLYRNAYVVQNTGHDFQELLKVCERILFVTTGYEPENEVMDALWTGLKEFSPKQDILVPVGNVTQNLLAGMLLQRMIDPGEPITIGIYYEKQYHFKHIALTSSAPNLIPGALLNGQD